MAEFQGCPGSRMIDRSGDSGADAAANTPSQSQLAQWPIQLHLVSPEAPYYAGADVLLVADCVAYALGNFHGEYLEGKSIAIACPNLDQNQETYSAKITAWLDNAKINTLTVMIMEVPCCMGLLALAQQAVGAATRKVPLKQVVVGLDGEIRGEDWVTT